MDELKRYERQITLRSIVVGVVIVVIVAIAWPEDRTIFQGLALGFTFSLLRFRLQVQSLIRFGGYAKGGDKKKAAGFLMSRNMANLATVIVALLIAALRPLLFEMLTVAAGLFLTNVVVMGNEVLIRAFGRAGR